MRGHTLFNKTHSYQQCWDSLKFLSRHEYKNTYVVGSFIAELLLFLVTLRFVIFIFL
jgi:hypothetical protein